MNIKIFILINILFLILYMGKFVLFLMFFFSVMFWYIVKIWMDLLILGLEILVDFV